MKVYISADIEGCTGVVHHDETHREKADYKEFGEQMTAEVNAACEGAIKAGAKEIFVKDAHGSARNINAQKLPQNVKISRNWSGHPFMMVDGIDSTYDAILFIGYHSRAGSNQNPLAHTMSGSIRTIKINGTPVSEMVINAYTAATVSVPLVFVSGDKGICDDVKQFNPQILTTAVKEGIGDSIVSIHPLRALDMIKDNVYKALSELKKINTAEVPKNFDVEIIFRTHMQAFKASFYPGVSAKDEFTITYSTKDFFDVLRLIAFVL